GGDPAEHDATVHGGPAPAGVHVPERPPHHGAGAEQLVPAVRPEPADLRARHLPGARGGLPAPSASGVPHRAVSLERGVRHAYESLTIPPQPSAGLQRLTIIRPLSRHAVHHSSTGGRSWVLH